jgi:hypothetical protein
MFKLSKILTKQFLFSLIFAILFSACSDDPREIIPAIEEPATEEPVTEPEPTPEPTPPPPDPANLSTCQSSVLDTGGHASNTNVNRGNLSDLRTIPGTSSIAIAYHDQGALSLKLAFWDGTSYVREVIAGEGLVANVISLTMVIPTTTLRPIVLWTSGTRVKVAIRSTALPTAGGTWTATTLENISGGAPRALDASANPLGQVIVSYLTNTTTAGRAKVLVCDAPCTSGLNFLPMTPNAYVENTNITAAQVQTGAAWCKVSDSLYYPAIVFSNATTVRYGVCRNGTLSNCAADTNWTLQNVVTAANVGNSVVLNSNVADDVPKVISRASTGLIPYRMGTTACSLAPGAFSAGTTLGGANTGTAWHSADFDSTGKFHLMTNESTTSIRYYNSQSTDFIGTWNALGTAETITTVAGFVGKAVMDRSLNYFYSSYGVGAAPFNLRLVRVNNSAVASNTATFLRTTPDTHGALQVSAATGQLSQIATAADNSEGLGGAYVDFSSGVVTTGVLKYTYKNTNSLANTWTSSIVPGPLSPQFPALAYDHLDRPWIGYFDATLNRFFLISNSRADGQGSWSSCEFPTTPSGGPAALPAANQVAVAMNYSGGTAKPVMLVLDTNTTSKGLYAARLNDLNCSWSTLRTLDSLAAGALGGSSTASAFTSSGKIGAIMYDFNTTRLKYYSSTDGDTWTSGVNISSAGAGQGASIAFEKSAEKPRVSYFDVGNSRVLLSSCSTAFASCSGNNWTEETVESSAGITGLAAGAQQILSTQLFYDNANRAHVIYPRGALSDGHLIARSYIAPSWTESLLSTGINAALPGVNVLNFGQTGYDISGIMNSTGSFSGLHLGPGNWIYQTHCGY